MLSLDNEFHPHCPGCLAHINEFHSDCCDVARCAITGMQLFTCGIFQTELEHICENTKWSGYWPGLVECFQYGLFAEFDHGWHKSDKFNNDAVPDLNTLLMSASWDYSSQKWIM